MAVFNSDLSARLAVAPPCSADDLHQTLSGLLNQQSARSCFHPFGLSTPSIPMVLSCWPSASWSQTWEAQSRETMDQMTVHKLIFQTANNVVNSIVHSAKTAYYSTDILAYCSSKQLHYITNTLLGKSESSPHPSTVHPSHLPQAFSDFFANKIDTIRHSLDTDSTSLPTWNDHQFIGQPLTAFHPVSEATVKDIIRQSSIKTCEFDPLPASFFNQCLDTLLPYITTAVNNSLMSGPFPESFKSTKRPLLKKPYLDPVNFGNYTAQSQIFPLYQTSLETVVSAQLLKHLQTNKLMYHLQSTYRSPWDNSTGWLGVKH